LKVTRGDYLVEFMNMTDEAYENSLRQAKSLEPLVVPEHVTKGLQIGPKGIVNLNSVKIGSGLRRGENIARIGAAAATGDVVGGTIAAGQLGIGEAMKTSAAKKAIAKQVAEITAKRGAKTVAKMVPGLDILISGKETMDYLKQGKLDQAGIAAVSGAIGWIPVIGDAASAALDLTNTGLDISRLSIGQRKKRKGTIKRPRPRVKISNF